MSDEITEGALEQFTRLYGTPERGRQLWEEWMSTQPEAVVDVMEKLARDLAEQNEISLEEAQTALAVRKVVEDRGRKFVERYLREHDLAQRRLKPLTLPRKKR
jgi:hypothetical protein